MRFKFRKFDIVYSSHTQSWLVLKVTKKWVKIKPLFDNGMGSKAHRVDIITAEFNIEMNYWHVER